MTRETIVNVLTGEVSYSGEPTAEEALAAWRAAASVSRFQLKAALANADYLEAVNAHVETQDAVTRLAWAEVETWARRNATMARVLEGIDLDDAAIDALFEAAAQISI